MNGENKIFTNYKMTETKKRLINLNIMSELSKKKIRTFMGKKSLSSLIKQAIADGLDVGKQEKTQIKRTYLYYGDMYNDEVEKQNKQIDLLRKQKPKKKTIKKTIKKKSIELKIGNFEKLYSNYNQIIKKGSFNIIVINDDGEVVRNYIVDDTNKNNKSLVLLLILYKSIVKTPYLIINIQTQRCI